MNTLRILILSTLAITALTACGDDTSYSGGDPDPEPETTEFELEATYISGHYGSYSDCREEAFNPNAEGNRQEDGEGFMPAPEDDNADADCADDEDCGGLFNCQHAQVTIELANPNDEDATTIDIAELLILDAEGIERASLPILSTQRTDDNTDFDGTLAAGAAQNLRIDFRGPLSLYDLLTNEDEDSDGDSISNNAAPLRILIKVNNKNAETLDTPAIDALPDIDT